MRATILVATMSFSALASPACKSKTAPDAASTTADAGAGHDIASAMSEAGTDDLSADFPSSVPPYPGATMSPTKKMGRQGKPMWTTYFQTGDDPGKVLLFYIGNLHGFQGSGETRPDGEIRGAWESPQYHLELQAAPLRKSPDAQPYVTSVMLWVDRK